MSPYVPRTSPQRLRTTPTVSPTSPKAFAYPRSPQMSPNVQEMTIQGTWRGKNDDTRHLAGEERRYKALGGGRMTIQGTWQGKNDDTRHLAGEERRYKALGRGRMTIQGTWRRTETLGGDKMTTRRTWRGRNDNSRENPKDSLISGLSLNCAFLLSPRSSLSQNWQISEFLPNLSSLV